MISSLRRILAIVPVLLSVLFGTAFNVEAKSKVNLVVCQASVQQPVALENMGACRALAETKKLTAREKAEIYFQLGIATSDKPVGPGRDLLSATNEELSNYSKAILADPSYIWPYYYLAETLDAVHNGNAAIAALQQGLTTIPDEPHLVARLAPLKYASGDEAKGIALCDSAMGSRNIDLTIATTCGELYRVAHLADKSFQAFEVASKTYVPGKRNRYGRTAYSVPVSGMSRALAMQGKHQEAIDMVTRYLERKDIGNERLWLLLNRADYYEEQKKFSEAADDLGKAALIGYEEGVPYLRMQQMFDLSQSGNLPAARAISDLTFGAAPLKFILRLQVRLKNAQFRDLHITGKFDDETKHALDRCLAEPTCFGGVVGQRV